jgi:hypothetical protein
MFHVYAQEKSSKQNGPGNTQRADLAQNNVEENVEENVAETAHDNYGPLLLYSQAPLQVNALTPQLRSGFSLPSGTVELTSSLTAASVWAVTPAYTADYYQNQIQFGGKWQVSTRWQAGLDYRWNVAADNHLDHVTAAFHKLFGISQNGRDSVDKDRFYLSSPDYGTEEDDFKNTTLSSALIGYLQYQIFTTQSQGLSIGGSIYYNDLGYGLFSNSRLEQGIQANYSFRAEPHQIDVLVGVASHHPQGRHLSKFPYRDTSTSLGISYTYQWTKKQDVILEIHSYQGLSTGNDDLSERSNEFVLRYRYHFASSALELSMIENIFNMDNSSDIAFTVGYRYRFH